MHKIKVEQKSKHMDKPLAVPENIVHSWYNLTDLRDRVALNYNLADDYQPNSNGISVIDKQVLNTYEYQGLINPHKSYGYLRTPQMAEIIYTFLCRGRSHLWIMLIETLHRLIQTAKMRRQRLKVEL